MHWVLMLFVVLAAVMGGEARAAVVMGRVEVSERGEKEAVARESEALRGASLGAVLVAEEAAGVEDAGPLVLWFPGGLAVARSDGLSGTGTTGCRRVSGTSWRYDLADNRVARTETEERRAANSTSWVRTAVADQRCLYRNAAGTGPNGRNQLSQSWETRTRWHAESGAPLELSEQTVSYRYDPRGNRTRRTTRLWKQARTTRSAAWPVPEVMDTDEALEWDGENRLTGMWRGRWKEELAQVPFESLAGEAVAGSVVGRWGTVKQGVKAVAYGAEVAAYVQTAGVRVLWKWWQGGDPAAATIGTFADFPKPDPEVEQYVKGLVQMAELGAGLVEAVLTMDFDKLAALGGVFREMFLMSPELYDAMLGEWSNKPSYDKGLLVGRATAEIGAMFMPWAKVARGVGKLSKADFLTELPRKSKFFAAGGRASSAMQRVVNDGLGAALKTTTSFFPAGTPVLTREGLRPIESLRVGDHVLARSEDGTR
jgi:hypothetical protein